VATNRLPLLRGRAFDGGPYTSPRSGGARPVPSRPDPKLHASDLLAQLDKLEAAVFARGDGARDERASREVVVLEPETGFQLDAPALASKSGDVRIIGTNPDSGAVILDAPGASLPQLRQKVVDYADDSKVKKTRANESAIAPLRLVQLASLDALGASWLRSYDGDRASARWFELGCRGGKYRPASDTGNSQHQMHHQLRRLGALGVGENLRYFLASELVYFFVRLSVEQLTQLLGAVDCIFEVEPVPLDVLSWLLFEDQPVATLRACTVAVPEKAAPSVVLLDSGVATAHPLLKAVTLSSASVLPGVASPEDTFGHGTKMAGVALFGDELAPGIQAGQLRAPHWLQSVRLLQEPGKGTASDDFSYLWPELTREAVERAEDGDPEPLRPRAFVLAVTRRSAPEGPTLWSQAVDQLAFNDGRGRLLCVSAGNPPDSRWLTLAKDYPQGQLTEKLHDPANAANALTVGAFTSKTQLPKDSDYLGAGIVARAGGISPFTSTGTLGRALKPDVVFEGGNLAVSGALADQNVPTLATLTTSHRWTTGSPIALINMTSEAAARAGHMAARMWSEDRSLRPETVRGLIVHSATWTSAMCDQFIGKEDRLAACGYGVPDFSGAIECVRDRATVIVEDQLANAVRKEVPREPGSRGRKTKVVEERPHKLFRLPIPDGLASVTADVEVRVTLSYFPEPSGYGRRLFYGMEIRWDMQGPLENEEQFRDRINEAVREKADGKRRRPRKFDSKGFEWTVGATLRSRGTVQSDWWRGPGALLAGSKLLVVFPKYGWWDSLDALRFNTQRFSLIATVTAPDVYAPVAAAIAVPSLITT
jgi:Subtilase family